MHLYDDLEPDKDPLFKDGGWRRSIILARADYCQEVLMNDKVSLLLISKCILHSFQTRENVEMILSKLGLLEALRKLDLNFKIINDLKVAHNYTGKFKLIMYQNERGSIKNTSSVI